ncbi:MAG: substrate-binding domain-containing protein, partial [Anaerolineales bacterium]
STLPMALQYQVAGIIVTSATLTSTLADECESYGTPVVLFNRYPLHGNLNAVTSDNEGGGRIVADALLDGGHNRIAYMAGQEGSSTNRDREKGFTERLLERGSHVFARESGDYYYNSGYKAAQRLLSNEKKPDAIFCANDLMAMATMDVARRHFDLEVPDDLSIIGFDDIPMASWPTYSLTTLHQPVREMVNATIDILIDTVHEVRSEGIVRMYAGELIDRGSARLVSDSE